MKFLLTVVALISFVMPHVVRAGVMYEVVVYFDNAPDDAAGKVTADSLILLNKFVSKQPGYKAVGPGQAVNYRSRELIKGNSNHVESEGAEEEEDFEGTMLRGFDRVLQAGSQCPAGCANSGGSYCRNIGCAYCGNSCSRRLQSAVSNKGAKEVEASINDDLVQYCENKVGCSITCKILKVKQDGTATPIV